MQIEKLCNTKLKELGISDKKYTDRLANELKYIELFDREEYILNLKSLIESGKEKKKPNKNGLVYAYLLGLTDEDPIEKAIPHNWYLSDPPDIDVDFSKEARDIVEDYLVEKHGSDRVKHIYTISLFSPKSSIRMLCRTMDLTRDQGVIKEICDYFGEEAGEGNDFDSQIKRFNELKSKLSKKAKAFLQGKPKYTKFLDKDDKKLNNEDLLFKYARKLSSQFEKSGKHASGLAISNRPFKEFAPLKKVKGEILLAASEGGHGKEASSLGILKFDYLGLETTTKHRQMFEMAEEIYGNSTLYDDIVYKSDFDDKETIEVFDNAETMGVFQFWKDGMRQALTKVRIKSFNDITIMNALWRPGAVKQLDELASRMHNPELIKYDKNTKEILKDTYGLIIFQEQVMKIMEVVGGFTSSESDKARGTLKKISRNKSPDKTSIEYFEYQKMLRKFEQGALKKGFTREQAEKFVQDLADQQGYSFNKSHSTAYSVTAYIDAYFKAHYPLIFYKTMCQHEDDKEKLSLLFQDAKLRGININGFDINKTNYDFDIDVEENELLIGFGMIKGVSKEIIDRLLAERDKNGKFENIVDFFIALDNMGSINKRSIEPLILLGAFDKLEPNRRKVMRMFEEFQTYKKKKTLKTLSKRMPFEDIFINAEMAKEPDYKRMDKINFEFKYLDLYLITNPLEFAKKYYDRHGVRTVTISEREDDTDLVLGIISNYKVKKTKNKDPYLDIAFTDMVDTINVKAWSNVMTEELQTKGAIGVFKMTYNDLFNSYNLNKFSILET